MLRLRQGDKEMKIKLRYFQNEKNQINRLWKIYNGLLENINNSVNNTTPFNIFFKDNNNTHSIKLLYINDFCKKPQCKMEKLFFFNKTGYINDKNNEKIIEPYCYSLGADLIFSCTKMKDLDIWIGLKRGSIGIKPELRIELPYKTWKNIATELKNFQYDDIEKCYWTCITGFTNKSSIKLQNIIIDELTQIASIIDSPIGSTSK